MLDNFTSYYCLCLTVLGYVQETFDLIWRRQDVDSGTEEEVKLYWNSTATLHESGMPAEPQRCYLLIREREDGTQPQRLQSEKKVRRRTLLVCHALNYHAAVGGGGDYG